MEPRKPNRASGKHAGRGKTPTDGGSSCMARRSLSSRRTDVLVALLSDMMPNLGSGSERKVGSEAARPEVCKCLIAVCSAIGWLARAASKTSRWGGRRTSHRRSHLRRRRHRNCHQCWGAPGAERRRRCSHRNLYSRVAASSAAADTAAALASEPPSAASCAALGHQYGSRGCAVICPPATPSGGTAPVCSSVSSTSRRSRAKPTLVPAASAGECVRPVQRRRLRGVARTRCASYQPARLAAVRAKQLRIRGRERGVAVKVDWRHTGHLLRLQQHGH